VAGPWVVVPAGLGVARTPVQFDLVCPKGYTVGGLDAELSDRAIDVSFQGKDRQPGEPGITTSRDALFTATYVGATKRGAPTFRPHIGCMPGSGGGGRIQTAVTFKVGQPVVHRVANFRLLPGVRRVSSACGKKQRLVGGSVATAFGGTTPPSAATVGTLHAARSFSGRRVIATAQVADAALGAARRPGLRCLRGGAMSFSSPWMLLTLLAIPLAIVLYRLAERRRMRYAVAFTNLSVLAAVAGKGRAWRRHVPTAIFLLALGALCVGLARPHRTTTVTQDKATVILVIDVSGSMQATDVAPTRLGAAQNAVRQL